MTLYCISYDLVDNKDYPKLYAKIKSYGTYIRIVESTWIIKTNDTRKQIIDNLIKATDKDDQLIVMKLTGSMIWINLPKEVVDWINNNS